MCQQYVIRIQTTGSHHFIHKGRLYSTNIWFVSDLKYQGSASLIVQATYTKAIKMLPTMFDIFINATSSCIYPNALNVSGVIIHTKTPWPDFDMV